MFNPIIQVTLKGENLTTYDAKIKKLAGFDVKQRIVTDTEFGSLGATSTPVPQLQNYEILNPDDTAVITSKANNSSHTYIGKCTVLSASKIKLKVL